MIRFVASTRRRQRFSMLGHNTRTLHHRVVRFGTAARSARQATGPSAEELRRQSELEQELRLARDIQQGLLLEAVPRLPGWELSAISLPARELGGDLYDFLPIENGCQGIMIGDVSGKGLPAALRMAVARTVFRHEARCGLEPGETLARINRSVLREIPLGMVTMLYAQLDLHEGTLVLANAGHNYPLLINGRVDELERSGLPLGIDGDSDYEELRVELAPGDTVLLYTDGVTEALNARGRLLGYEQLEQLIQRHRTLKPRALLALLLHELRAWTGGSLHDDDVTMVVLRRRLPHLGDELRSIVEDVLGAERASEVWRDLPDDDAAETWAAALPDLSGTVQVHYGRGLARELHQQVRIVIDEYRELQGYKQ